MALQFYSVMGWVSWFIDKNVSAFQDIAEVICIGLTKVQGEYITAIFKGLYGHRRLCVYGPHKLIKG